MLGSGINPESFKQDYSGFARAAEIQAQGMSNLGASIGGAIEEVGDYFKKQKEDEKKVQKSLSVAKAIGDLIPGLQPTIQGSLDILNDKEIPLSQRTAEADAISDILNLGINEVRNRQDIGFKERELGIREAEALARNEPPMPEPFSFTGTELKKTEKGGIYVLKGSDGLDYDPKTKLPIFDLAAFGEGLPPEVWSGGSTFSDDRGSMTTPSAFLPEENPSDAIDYANSLTGVQGGGFPTNLNIASPSPLLSPSQIESAANLSSNPLLGTPSGDNSDLLAIGAADQAALKPRYITGKEKAEAAQEPVIITAEKLSELVAMGVRPSGSLNPDGTFNVTDFNTASLPPGMTIESDGQGGVKIVQGAGVGEGKKELTEEKKKNIIRLRSQASANILRDIDTAIELIGESGGPLQRTAMAIYPGGAANALKKVLSSLEASFAIEQLMTLRATGTTLGQVPQAQAQMLAQLMGPLGSEDAIGLRDDILLKTLIDARQSYGALLNETMEAIPKDLRSDVDIVNKMLKKYRKERNLDEDDNKTPTSRPFTVSPEAEDVFKRHPTGK